MKLEYKGWTLEARRERIWGERPGACTITTQGLDPDGVEMIGDSQDYCLGYTSDPKAPRLADVLNEMRREVDRIEKEKREG